jgi:hypothetical protein
LADGKSQNHYYLRENAFAMDERGLHRIAAATSAVSA